MRAHNETAAVAVAAVDAGVGAGTEAATDAKAVVSREVGCRPPLRLPTEKLIVLPACYLQLFCPNVTHATAHTLHPFYLFVGCLTHGFLCAFGATILPTGWNKLWLIAGSCGRGTIFPHVLAFP